MAQVMVFGTFNILHQGHVSLFEQACTYGYKLYVVVARNETVVRLKKYIPTDENERVKVIRNVKGVSCVLLGDLKDKFKAIREIKPDVIALGYDQTFFVSEIEKFVVENGLKITLVRLKAFEPEKYKSSILMKERRLV